MRIRVLSDLHLNLLWEQGRDLSLEPVDCDAVPLAGDIAYGGEGVEWATKTLADIPVVYVIGNHDYYFQRMPDALLAARTAARGSNVIVLEQDRVRIGSVVFQGRRSGPIFYSSGLSSEMRAPAAQLGPSATLRRSNWVEFMARPDSCRTARSSCLRVL